MNSSYSKKGRVSAVLGVQHDDDDDDDDETMEGDDDDDDDDEDVESKM